MQTAEWLFDLLLKRRSRRFCLGMKIPAGALAFESRFASSPLTLAEEARLAFAAAGITGPVLPDLDLSHGSGANILAGLVGRTVPSGDAIQSVALIVVNDNGSFYLKRPENLSETQLVRSLKLAKENQFESLYQENTVRLSTIRKMPVCEPLINLNLNRWSFGARGTSYFLPINDLTFIYINGLLEILSEETGTFILDDRARLRPAGLKPFAASRGGHLKDDPKKGRIATISIVERMVAEFVAIEQGMMLQNLALTSEALGLGGFPNFANHDLAWFESLEFEHETMRTSTYLGASFLPKSALRLARRDAFIRFPIGLKKGGEILMKSYAPPHFASMRKAVEAVVVEKERRLGGTAQSWCPFKNGGNPTFASISSKAVEATIAYCDYLWEHYGRFPAQIPRFKTVAGFQAGHLDMEYYDRFYGPGHTSESHRKVFQQYASPQKE